MHWNNGNNSVRVRLKGIAKVRARFCGKTVTYHYAWRGGPRINAEPGTAEFLKLYNDAVATLQVKSKATLMALIADYKASPLLQEESRQDAQGIPPVHPAD